MIFYKKYKKPIMLVGNGVRSSGAVGLLHEFAYETNIPVITTMNGVDLVQDDLHIGFIGTHGNRVANMILNECDLVISVGARLGIRQVGRISRNFAPKADLIRCDIDEYELSRNIKPNETKYHTDAKDFIRLLKNEDIGNFLCWKNQCIKAKNVLDKYDKQPGNLVIEKICSLLPRNPVIAVDVGMHQCWCAQSLVLKGNNGRIHMSGGYGTMGCGLPYAIGSSIALGGGICYCIVGDGGFQMNIQELETIKREELPVKIFVINNRVLGKISETQFYDNNKRFANTTAESGYTTPDFKKVAEAYGIKAARLDSYAGLDRYEKWIHDGEPCLLDIILPKRSLLTPKIKFETGEIRPKLDSSVINLVGEILQG